MTALHIFSTNHYRNLHLLFLWSMAFFILALFLNAFSGYLFYLPPDFELRACGLLVHFGSFFYLLLLIARHEAHLSRYHKIFFVACYIASFVSYLVAFIGNPLIIIGGLPLATITYAYHRIIT